MHFYELLWYVSVYILNTFVPYVPELDISFLSYVIKLIYMYECLLNIWTWLFEIYNVCYIYVFNLFPPFNVLSK